MSDEELIEAIYDSLLTTVAAPLEFATDGQSPLNSTHLMDAAKEALAALRENCSVVTVEEWWIGYTEPGPKADPGFYYLVPTDRRDQ